MEQNVYNKNFKPLEKNIPDIKILKGEEGRDEDNPINNIPEEGNGEEENNEPEEAL